MQRLPPHCLCLIERKQQQQQQQQQQQGKGFWLRVGLGWGLAKINKEEPGCGMQILAVVACLGWMGVSSGLIMVNKYIMSTDNFRYPMALSGLGMLFSSFASFFVCRVRLSPIFSPSP